MASQKELLSVKGQDKMEKLKDAKWDDMGGPELDWSIEKLFSSSKFNTALGISPDTTILSKASVKAEKGETVKEAVDREDDEEFRASEDDLDEARDDDEGQESEPEKSEEPKESEDDEDVPADEADEAPRRKREPVEEAPADDDNEFSFSLDELVDGDLEMTKLGDDSMEEGSDYEDDSVEEGSGYHDDVMDEAADEGDDVEMAPRMRDTDVEEAVEDGEDRMYEEDESELGAGDEEMPRRRHDADEMGEARDTDDDETMDEGWDAEDEDESEDKSVKESRLVLSFKFDEADRLFESNTLLSEEDKQQSRRLFEAAIRDGVKQAAVVMNEAYGKKYKKAKTVLERKMAKKIDQYLSYVVEQWAAENKVAVKSQIQSKLMENFMTSLRNTFVNHYIDIPESRVNIVEALAKNVKALKKELRESEARTVKLNAEMKVAVTRERQTAIREHKSRLIAEAANLVPASERGDFARRAGSVAFTTTKNFKKDLVTLREQYFGAKSSKSERSMSLPDAAPLFEEKTPKTTTSAVDQYVRVAERFAR